MNALNLVISFLRTFIAGSDTREAELVAAFESAPVGSTESLTAELALTKYRLSHATEAKPKTLRVSAVKVSEKGGINVFGLRRFPVNLYPAELLAICEALEDGTILRFLESNESKLSRQKTEA